MASTPKPRGNWQKKVEVRSDKIPSGLNESSPKLAKAGVTARDKSDSSQIPDASDPVFDNDNTVGDTSKVPAVIVQEDVHSSDFIKSKHAKAD